MAFVSRATNRELAELGKLVRDLENRLARLGTHAASDASQAIASSPALESLAEAVADLSDRLRGGAADVTQRAADMTHRAAHVGQSAMRRLGREVEHRPLATIGIAVGIGVLIGLLSRRS